MSTTTETPKWDRMGWIMGLSARAIEGGGKDHPHDPSDLVRCVKYCEQRGITTEALRARMGTRSTAWARLTAHWDTLVDLLKDEVETNTRGMAPRTYAAMKRIIADGIACQTCDSTGRGTECQKCKGSGRRAGGRCRAPGCYGGAATCPACHGRGYLGGDR